MCGCLSHAPYLGPGLQPSHVSWLGITLVTLWFSCWNSIHRATPARADLLFIISLFLMKYLFSELSTEINIRSTKTFLDFSTEILFSPVVIKLLFGRFKSWKVFWWTMKNNVYILRDCSCIYEYRLHAKLWKYTHTQTVL